MKQLKKIQKIPSKKIIYDIIKGRIQIKVFKSLKKIQGKKNK